MKETLKEQIEIVNQQIKELASIYRDAASRCGISDNEFWLWYAPLVLGGEYSQQDICDMWSLPKQTVNSVIANWSKKGFAFLETVPGTRNRKIIRLTIEGEIYGKNIVFQISQAELRSFEQLTVHERELYITLVRKYINLLKGEIYER